MLVFNNWKIINNELEMPMQSQLKLHFNKW